MDCWLRKCGGCRTKTGRYRRDRRGNAGAFQTRNDWQKNKRKATLHTFHKRRKSHCRARTSQRHGNGKLGMSCSITGRPVWHRKRDYKTRSSHEQAGKKKSHASRNGGSFWRYTFFFFLQFFLLSLHWRQRRDLADLSTLFPVPFPVLSAVTQYYANVTRGEFCASVGKVALRDVAGTGLVKREMGDSDPDNTMPPEHAKRI